MASSGLKGSFPLTDEKIDEEVTKTSPGAYALGDTLADANFGIDYVGRSDTDVNNRLHDHVGKYKRFKYDYFPSAKTAFEKECNLWHDFDPPNNKVHPARPNGTSWKCPAAMLLTRVSLNQCEDIV